MAAGTDKTFSDKAAAWAFPIVTGLVGFFMVDKLNSIDKRLEKLEVAALLIPKLATDIEHLEERLEKVEHRQETYYMKADEITAPKRRLK